jgi:tRNA (cmo5U34)-methyltransferase
MVQDKLFAEKREVKKDFDFGEETASVFDDMLIRSVPFYAEIQRMIGELAAEFAVEGTNLYDLGCSTCNTFLALDRAIPQRVRFIGMDSSPEMLKRGREKLAHYGTTRDVELILADLNERVRITNASVVIINLTLQFVRPMHRPALIKSIAEGLNDGGCLLVVEKVVTKDPTLNRLFIKNYYGFKQRNGYSELEIAQKREALENVLVPYWLEENVQMLSTGGFSEVDVFFKWYNFCGLIATK